MTRMKLLAPMVFSALSIALASCGDGGAGDKFDAASPSEFVSWLNRNQSRLTDVAFDGGVLTARHGQFSSLVLVGADVQRVLAPFMKAASNPSVLKRVKMVYSSELVDKYQNSVGQKPVLAVIFDAQDAMKYNFERATWVEMLQTAKIEFKHPAIARDIAEFCSEYAKYRIAVCR